MTGQKSVGVALIGGGIWAREEHLPAIQSSKHLLLKAVYSRSAAFAEAIQALCPGIAVYADDSDNGFTELIKRSDIEAVVVALLIAKQMEYIRAALSAGKSVLSEKPVAENLHDARQLIEYCRSSECSGQWSVSENWRFLNSINYARDEVSKLGRVLGFRVQIYDNIQQGWKYFETEWRKTPTHQGGFLPDGGVPYAAGLRRLLASDPQNRVA